MLFVCFRAIDNFYAFIFFALDSFVSEPKVWMFALFLK